MELQICVIFILCSMSHLSLGNSEHTFSSFLTKHYADIEHYVMSGYGDGWKHCDHLIIGSNYNRIQRDAPSLVMNVETLQNMDISSTFSRAHCILLVAHINDATTLSKIIQFGWTMIQHRRIGMVMRMESNVGLEETRNTTKMPFIVASVLQNGTEQFLCPSIGRNEPILQAKMCGMSHTSFVGKTVNVGVYGHWPYVHMGHMFGVDVMLLNLLKEKMMFNTKIELSPSFDAAFDAVWKCKQHEKLKQIHPYFNFRLLAEVQK